MSRSVEVTVPSHRTEALLREIRRLDELIGVQVQRGVSIEPPGDVITVSITNRSLRALIRLLDERGVTDDRAATVWISEPSGVISPAAQEAIENDASEIVWEEMEYTILRESSMRTSALLVMGVAGVLAAVGIATGAVHLVIGGMVIAPGFEPLTRVSLGLAAGGRDSWRHGLLDTAKGYAALLLGALLTAIALRLSGRSLLSGGEAYLPTESLVSFWLQFSLPSLLVAACAGAAGAVLVAANRSVLTAGVMIALALIPPPAVAALALVSGDATLAGTAALRWVTEAAIVVVAGLLVFAWHRVSIQQRAMTV